MYAVLHVDRRRTLSSPSLHYARTDSSLPQTGIRARDEQEPRKHVTTFHSRRAGALAQRTYLTPCVPPRLGTLKALVVLENLRHADVEHLVHFALLDQLTFSLSCNGAIRVVALWEGRLLHRHFQPRYANEIRSRRRLLIVIIACRVLLRDRVLRRRLVRGGRGFERVQTSAVACSVSPTTSFT